MQPILVVILIDVLVIAPLTAWLAGQRGRSPSLWFIVAAIAGPLALLVVGAVCVAIWFGFLRTAPTAEQAVRRAVSPRWFIAGAIALATAIAIPIIDGGELNQVWWSVMMLLLVAGVGLLVTAVSLTVSSRRPSY